MNTIGLLGIPYDKKSSFLQGPALAPALIRSCMHSGSAHYTAENGINTQTELVKDLGDLEIEAYFDIESGAERWLQDGYRLLSLGGDHSVTFPLVKAFSQQHGPVQILHIDAHTDLYHEFDGDPHSHACPFARIMEGGHASRLVQVGIRSLNAHQKEQAEKFGVEIHPMQDLDIEQVPIPDAPLYLSIDLDGLDPAFAPGVSHHEPGGLTTRQVIRLIQRIETPIVGADIVEYNPHRDWQGITAAVAAKLLKEVLGKMLEVSP